MNATTLPRMQFKVDGPESERVKLAKAASEKLDYKKLANAIAVPGALLYALRELGIEPLVDSQVKAYKQSKTKVGMWSGTKKFLLRIAGVVTMGSACIYGLTNRAPTWSPAHYAANFGAGLIMLICFIWAMAEGNQIGNGTRKYRYWQSSRLSSYGGNVPEFALSKAVEIATARPDTLFSVEQLVDQDENKTAPRRDPFLVATLKDESYYIDVWDEKEYEATI